jgi:hypothetical protein
VETDSDSDSKEADTESAYSSKIVGSAKGSDVAEDTNSFPASAAIGIGLAVAAVAAAGVLFAAKKKKKGDDEEDVEIDEEEMIGDEEDSQFVGGGEGDIPPPPPLNEATNDDIEIDHQMQMELDSDTESL